MHRLSQIIAVIALILACASIKSDAGLIGAPTPGAPGDAAVDDAGNVVIDNLGNVVKSR